MLLPEPPYDAAGTAARNVATTIVTFVTFVSLSSANFTSLCISLFLKCHPKPSPSTTFKAAGPHETLSAPSGNAVDINLLQIRSSAASKPVTTVDLWSKDLRSATWEPSDVDLHS